MQYRCFIRVHYHNSPSFVYEIVSESRITSRKVKDYFRFNVDGFNEDKDIIDFINWIPRIDIDKDELV